MKLHLLAHNHKNLVKTGDTVEKYKTKVGAIGTANGAYWAHLHHSVSQGLYGSQLRAYTFNWSAEKVKEYYEKPDSDYEKMFGRKMDVGNAGYNWLQWIGNGYHPGLDINGLGGGNSDLGYEFTSPCDGKVIFAGGWGGGWGQVLLIEENNNSNNNVKTYYIKSDLRNVLKKFDKDFDHEKSSHHKKLAGELDKYLDEEKDRIAKVKEVVKQNETLQGVIEQNNKDYKSQLAGLIEEQEKRRLALEAATKRIEELEKGSNAPGVLEKAWIWMVETFWNKKPKK